MRRPRWIISAGFAGGLVDAVARQHLVLATSVMDESGSELAIPGSWGAASAGVHLGRLLTVDRIVRTAEEKRQLAEKWSACACDMETSAVLGAAQEQGIGLLSVRVVTDDLRDELPPDIESILEQKSFASRLGAAAGAVLRRPASVKEMWNLREQAIVASDRLARVLQGLIPSLLRHQES
jgi:adenosylhomocysteine nucleosidase